MDERTKNVMAIIAKFAPKLAPHGVKLSAEDAEKKELEAMALMSEAVLDNGNKIYTPAADNAARKWRLCNRRRYGNDCSGR
jgi:hypothetical protein